MCAALAGGYLLGTISSADAASRLAGGPDLRTAGSGNPGGANAGAVLGRRWGATVMAADVVKGVLACSLGRTVACGPGAHLAGTAAVVGHCFPLWQGGRGGKGVATAVGQGLATFPAAVPVELGAALLAARLPGAARPSLRATIAGCVAWVAAAIVWWRRDLPNPWGPATSAALPLAASTSAAVVLWRFVSSAGGSPVTPR